MPDASSATLTSTTYQLLRRKILTTELPPGSPLNARVLRPTLDVGRTPLRSAINLLAHDGLVEVTPRQGSTVAQLTTADLYSIFELRLQLEPFVAAQAISHFSRDNLTALKTLYDSVNTQTSPDSDDDVDNRFHRTIAEMTHNPYLVQAYHRLCDESLRLHYLFAANMESVNSQADFINTAIGMIETKNKTGLESLFTDHVKQFYSRISAALLPNSHHALPISS